MKKIPKEKLLEEIRRLNDIVNNTPPTKKQMDNIGEHSGRTYINRFGGWNEAVEEAGFSSREQRKEQYRDRPDCCPLCEQSGILDFHHWKYGENESGCYLCRDCHEAVHQGKAKPNRNSAWLTFAVENLIRRHADIHGSINENDVLERYNLGSEELLKYCLEKLESKEGGEA